jgi:hypothetical protein
MRVSRTSLTLLTLLLTFPTAHAVNEGMATYFLGVGYPYGACGVPDEIAAYEGGLDTVSGQGNPFDYVALNVYNTPRDYTPPGPRPLTGADTTRLGEYNNGRNCGRWLRLTLGDTCDGANDGAMNQPFCRGGTGWHPNRYTGSQAYAVVFDQCTDGNAWCRDSRWHLDLHVTLLGKLRKDGQLLPPLAVPVLGSDGKPKADPNNPWAIEYRVTGFENPKVSWEYVTAPNYQGEPRFWFSLDSKTWYMRLIVTHLPNGIHGLEQLVDGIWKPARMEGDAGQMWILPDPSVKNFTVRLTDADDQPVLGGRTWSFDYPAACGTSCTKPATLADNLRGQGGVVGTASRSPASRLDLRLDRDGTLRLGSSFDGFATLLRPDGSARGRFPVASGRAATGPLSPGLWIVRWEMGEHTGTALTTVR